MSLQESREVLRSELLHLGFVSPAISESPLTDVDLSVSTPCFQAFFKLVDRIESLEPTWKSIQETIARYKSEHQNVPRDLYLTFLLLDVVSAAQLPLLQSIAADPLVCRKIILATKPDHLSDALESLPFVSMGTAVTRPPPGLQDIFAALEERGYPAAVLAVLSDRMNTDRMLTRLLDMPIPSEVPHLMVNELHGGVAQAVPSHFSRLKKLTVKDFRGIRKADLDFSANVTVIYGQNGTGKTSIFDALEWLLVGSVERLETESKDDTSGRSPYINLFSNVGAAATAEVSVGNHQSTITRTSDTSGHSSLSIDDEEPLDDRNALTLIIGQQSAKLDTRVLRRLVRTTSFLSQSTLKRFLSDDPHERYWSLAHLLGTQDYLRLLEKIDEIRKNIDRQNGDLSTLLKESAIESESIITQIKAREALVSDSAGARDLDKALAELLKQMVRKLQSLNSLYRPLFSAKSTVDEVQSSIAIVSDWSDKEIRQEKLSADKLALAADAASRRGQLVSALEELAIHQTNVEADLQRAFERQSTTEGIRAERETDLAAISATLERLKNEQNRQREALVIIEQMKGLRIQAREQHRQLASLDSELADHARLKSQRVEELTPLTATRQRNAVEVKQVRDQLKALDEAEGIATTYSQLVPELPSLQQRIRDSVARLAERQQEASELRIRISSIQQEITALSTERERQMASLERLRSLLADIQHFITSSECPLCGHKWQSSEVLKQAVEARTSWLSPRVKQLDEQLLQMHQRLTISEAALSHAEQELDRFTAARKDAESRTEQVHNTELQLRELLLRTGVPLEAERASLANVRETKNATLTTLIGMLTENDSTLARLRDELSQLEAETTRKQEVRERMAARLGDTQRRINTFLAQLGQFSFNAEPDSELLQQQTRATALEIQSAETRRTSMLREFTNSDSAVQECKLNVASKNRAAEEGRRNLSALNDSLKRLDDVFFDAQVDKNATPELIGRKLAERTARIAALDDIRNTLRKLGQISSWQIARREIIELNKKLDSIAQKDAGLALESKVLSRWHSHLSTLYVALVSIKTEVENLQLEKYGPTINLLYQRLNIHPLFNGLKVLVDAAAQAVTIHLRTLPSLLPSDMQEGLAPARYFSEAQLNVVALSIFLSHSFQQRWSRFVPLFLDDPVQNMDDFNANGFVDCLRSLADPDRQFVVSTCDIRLYRLLLLKLRCMNEGGSVRFRAYRLEGISDRGPRIIQDLPVSEPSAVEIAAQERVQ